MFFLSNVGDYTSKMRKTQWFLASNFIGVFCVWGGNTLTEICHGACPKMLDIAQRVGYNGVVDHSGSTDMYSL
jgi:hypothetical protein